MISVILPVRNEERNIRSCLDAILAQDYPQDQMEILAADGMSSDQTRAIIGEFQSRKPNIFLIDNPGKIVSTGMNAALLVSRGEIIIRVDGHTRIAPDYVRKCADILNRTSADNVGGRMDARGETPFGKAVAVATSSPFGVGGARFHYSNQEEFVDTVYMGAWPRRVFERIGLFDEELVRDQDDEFNYRLLENGGKILLSPDIRSVYSNRSTPKALWKQYFQYGYFKVRVLQKHPRQMRLRQFIPPVFVLSLILSAVLGLIFHKGWLLLITIITFYVIANLTATFIITSSRKTPHFLFLPFTFAILHVSYGLGFLCGLVKFWNRWGDKLGKTPDFR